MVFPINNIDSFALFVLALCPYDISVDVGDFVNGLRQISSFVSVSSSVDAIVL